MAVGSVTWTPSTQATADTRIKNKQYLSFRWISLLEYRGLQRMHRPTSSQAGMEKDEDFEVDWILLFEFEDLGKS